MKKLKQNWKFLVGVILIGIVFFAYNIVLNWDASEYIGLSTYIGTSKMMDSWIEHRGIIFPLILRLSQPFGIQSKWCMLITMFIFYVIMLIFVYKIYKKYINTIEKNKKLFSAIYIIGVIFFIIINPIIFAYFHVLLTEFVAMPIILASFYITSKWINTKKKKTFLVILSIFTIILYHLKQAYVVAPLSAMVFAGLLSCIKDWNLKNALYRIRFYCNCANCSCCKYWYLEICNEKCNHPRCP